MQELGDHDESRINWIGKNGRGYVSSYDESRYRSMGLQEEL